MITTHEHNDGRVAEAKRTDHSLSRWEDPTITKYSFNRDLRSDLVLADPVLEGEDERLANERINHGPSGAALGNQPGRNNCTDQARSAYKMALKVG